jgi:flagellin
MTSINAGGAFYRVQNSINQNSENVSKSMQRLASGKQNIAPGDRTASSAVAFGVKGELASLKVGIQNATEVLQAVEMANNDLSMLNEMVVRLEELNALGGNAFNSTEDVAAITAEATAVLAEIALAQSNSQWKGTDIFGTSTTVKFGKSGGSLAVTLTTVAANGVTGAAVAALKTAVDAQMVAAGTLYNKATNTITHLGSLNAGYALDVASKMDVDFAGETTELAKGQILAQAGTAMLAQANAQGQGMLALIQS